MKYRIDHDLHLHSYLSRCSKDPAQTGERILQYAKEQGFCHICLTDHFWDDAVPGASKWYSPQNYAHICEALPLPRAEGIRFDFGCETDLDRFMTLGVSREVMDTLNFIIVPTSHLHMKGFTVEEGSATVEQRAKVYMERNHALLDMALPFHKMGLAHFTSVLIDRGCEGNHIDILNAISDAQYAELFERVAACGMGVELNTLLEDGCCEAVLRPYRIAKTCGCKFYLGSDSHTVEELAEARPRFEVIVDALELTEDDKFAFVARA